MHFNSWEFLILLLITFFAYYSTLLRAKQILILIFSSFVFYAYSQPALLLLLVLAIFLNIVVTYGLLRSKRFAHRFLVVGVIANLAILGFFKYGMLIAKTAVGAFFGSSAATHLPTIPLPVGISFFTFQGISLIVDAYRDPEVAALVSGLLHKPTQFFKEIALFKAFFPQLVAGPIVKAHEFIPQIRQKYLRDVQWEVAVKALITGYFLKMVFADNLKEHTFFIAYPYYQGFSSMSLIVLIYGYSMQIFADFAGYSLIAIGLGQLFGYSLPKNFDFPYISQSFSEFWRRWHISLSTWLRLYLYIPLGGNRLSSMRTYFNLMIVMVLGGLWHGAAWSYAVWGGFHGLALAAERFLGERLRFRSSFGLRLIRGIFVFCFVTVAWLLFKLTKFGEAVDYIRHIGTNWDLPMHKETIFSILLFSLPIIFYHLGYLLKMKLKKLFLNPSEIVALVYAMMLFAIIFNSGTAGEFIYFQF